MLVISFLAFALANMRMETAQRAAKLNDMAVREVHHRVKNGLQLMLSMIQLRARQHDDAVVKAELMDLATRFAAEREYMIFCKTPIAWKQLT
jgi:two-component sensor histidine kinase